MSNGWAAVGIIFSCAIVGYVFARWDDWKGDK